MLGHGAGPLCRGPCAEVLPRCPRKVVDGTCFPGGSEKRHELLHSQTGLADERSQRAFRDRLVVGDREAAERWSRIAEDHVASGLAVEKVAELAESFGCLPASDDGKLAQTAISTVSS